jgi:hypothetical protein
MSGALTCTTVGEFPQATPIRPGMYTVAYAEKALLQERASEADIQHLLRARRDVALRTLARAR